MKRIFFLLLPLLIGIGGFSCSRKQSSPQSVTMPPPEEIQKKPVKEEIVLNAMARGDQVWIDLSNYLPLSLNVYSEQFAIINPDQDVVTWDPATMHTRLPRTMLANGQSVTGILQFKMNRNLVGLKLVYNPRPQAEPVITEIKPYQQSVFKPAR